MLGCPYSFVPVDEFQDHCRLAPVRPVELVLRAGSSPSTAAIRAPVGRGNNYQRGLGLLLGWFASDQQWHLAAQCMHNLPTMTVLAGCSEHSNVQLCTLCLLCGDRQHMW